MEPETKNAAYWERRALKAEEANAELEEWKRENIIIRVDMDGLGSCAITVGEPLTRQDAIIAAGDLLIKCTKEMLGTEETILRYREALLRVAEYAHEENITNRIHDIRAVVETALQGTGGEERHEPEQ
jgi:hypothetical protein